MSRRGTAGPASAAARARARRTAGRQQVEAAWHQAVEEGDSEDEHMNRIRARMEAFDEPSSDENEEQPDMGAELPSDSEQVTYVQRQQQRLQRQSRRPRQAVSEDEDEDEDEDDTGGADETDDADQLESEESDDDDDVEGLQIQFDDDAEVQRYHAAAEDGFQALQALQEEMGLKAFRQLKARAAQVSQTASTGSTGQQPAAKKPRRQRGSSAPQEVSSKRRPRGVRQVVASYKPRARDPRFEAVSGTFHADKFDRNYEFLEEKQQQELDTVRQELRRTKDPERQEQVKRLLQSLRNKQADRKAKRTARERDHARRQAMHQAGLIDQETGLAKYHLKKSTQRQLDLLAQYDQLKSNSQLNKAMKTRRKHRVAKLKKSFPNKREEY
ncbi:uncharacterized protein MONBRDRAFT_35572 [Monosiga brevicollis MX1]|uniref:rRNA biogenesis protein RRP36 n=1 Tax=Monosiga brevicollis TaxID=81824 RepID=A9UQ08_MONBE|nr:uncharacterized protein MONBRDRAFT_35572 [Monosiga brevicollis MX1]EDQ92513.1 predicted protein [Monosiga brevicollis MX1]|eukprot:XP_001742275.1 hypothetical protein [Monosiga brevicollis MX1]